MTRVDDTTKSETKAKKATANRARIYDQFVGRRVELDSVEKALLGIAPDNADEFAARSASLVPTIHAARLANVRSFLAEQPELREALAQQVEEAWQTVGGNHGEFLARIAERRAQILSQAELAHWRSQTPQAIADFRTQLARYLVEMEGLG